MRQIKGFALDADGDVIIKNNTVRLVEDTELLLQRIKTVLGTNQGEWVLDKDEGIVFSNILGKNVTEEEIKDELERGLMQVDENLRIISLELIDLGRRKFNILLKVQLLTGEETIELSYG